MCTCGEEGTESPSHGQNDKIALLLSSSEEVEQLVKKMPDTDRNVGGWFIGGSFSKQNY